MRIKEFVSHCSLIILSVGTLNFTSQPLFASELGGEGIGVKHRPYKSVAPNTADASTGFPDSKSTGSRIEQSTLLASGSEDRESLDFQAKQSNLLAVGFPDSQSTGSRKPETPKLNGDPRASNVDQLIDLLGLTDTIQKPKAKK